MALIKCDECGQQVSTKAATCPHCGAPVVARPTKPRPMGTQMVPHTPSSKLGTMGNDVIETKNADGVPITRNALLLHLGTVCRLMLIKRHINELKNTELGNLNNKMINAHNKIKENYWYNGPDDKEIWHEASPYGWGGVFLGCVFSVVVAFIFRDFIEATFDNAYLFVAITFLPAWIIFWVWGYKRTEKKLKEYYRSKSEEAEASRVKYTPIRDDFEAKKNKKEKYWKEQLNIIQTLINDTLAANIIPKDWRNLEAIYYIYTNMRTSGLTWDKLIALQQREGHKNELKACMQEFFQEFLARQDYMIYQNMRNDALNKRMISQNEQMLQSLGRIGDNTAQAACYSKMAADYSRYNAFINTATYLEIKK